MRVLICDDQAIIREGIELLLRLESDIEVVGTATNGYEGVRLAEQHRPDLVLMDLKMPEMNGIEATRRISQQFPEIKVLVLTTFDEDEWLFDALRAGAAGYLLKDTPRADLVKAIRGTVAGKTYMDPMVAGRLVEQIVDQSIQPPTQITDKLTEREIVVLQLLAAGHSNQEIAGQLHVSKGTVRNHISAIFRKLEVNDRTQAALIAIRHGLAT
ncbi:MAG: response regulator transcription factor [Chloroflexota bacterium]